MKNDKEQNKAKRSLRRNFFREAMVRELKAEERKARKKLSTPTNCDVK